MCQESKPYLTVIGRLSTKFVGASGQTPLHPIGLYVGQVSIPDCAGDDRNGLGRGNPAPTAWIILRRSGFHSDRLTSGRFTELVPTYVA